MSPPSHFIDFLNQFSRRFSSPATHPVAVLRIVSYVLCFAAASISSAGGVGGGSLYLPILNIVAGMDLKAAAAVSSSMVTAGSVSSVVFNLIFFSKTSDSAVAIIDYEIALMSEPSMLLGVSAGVLCNVVFPEWFITILFSVFLGCSTYKICRAGRKCWKEEDEEEGKEEPLLGEGNGEGIQWRKVMILVFIWITFFVLHALVGSKDGKSIIYIEKCGVSYWLITLLQLPIALVLTLFILHDIRRRSDNQKEEKGGEKLRRVKDLHIMVFPLAALLSGIMGGLFGIGGGLLINPLLLQIGVPPQVTAGTTSFMVLFSSSMSLVQFLILGMDDLDQAMIFSCICFFASIVGLLIIQRAVERSGRTSLIVFSVGVVMALSTVSITCFGAIDVLRDYLSGSSNMGFKLPC